MAIDYLREARSRGDDAAILRYAHLHLGDGNVETGRAEVDKAYVVAIKALIESPVTPYAEIRTLLGESDIATLAHIFLYTHLELVRRSGDWIHDGEL